MKRLFSVFLCVFMLFLTSCSNPYFLDISLFCKSFNEEITSLDIKPEKFLVKESEKENSCYLFSNLGTECDFLISLKCEKDSQRIKSCSLTVLGSEEDMKKGKADIFRNTAICLINVMTIKKDNPQEIIKNLKIPAGKNFAYSNSAYFETSYFKYAYCSNELGANLTIKNKLLEEEVSTLPTLRKDESQLVIH